MTAMTAIFLGVYLYITVSVKRNCLFINNYALLYNKRRLNVFIILFEFDMIRIIYKGVHI